MAAAEVSAHLRFFTLQLLSVVKSVLMLILLRNKSVKVRNYKPDQLFFIWNQGFDRMDTMEIDDNLYINKNLTMEGLVTKGRRSAAALRNLRNLFVLLHLLRWFFSC